MWFEELTGFKESSEQVHKQMSVNGSLLRSHANGREFICGTLETPSLKELRERVTNTEYPLGNISVSEIIADVQELHCDKSNTDALFQVASQFNLLEMISPNATPEQGIDRYEYDRTQGPACAIAAGAGTIYRNYFAKVNNHLGQTSQNQIDCLAGLGKALGNRDNHLWTMENGYALATEEGLQEITNKIDLATESELDELRKLLQIGIQWNTEVTLNNSKHTVTQAYCSALPVAYSQQSSELWEAFARLILEASYEATICAGILSCKATGNNKVYLTLLGGGAFGNEKTWIIDAIQRALNIYKNIDLDIIIVSYGSSDYQIQQLIHQF